MVIGICGYGYSGSGALQDYLRQWDECSCSLTGYEFNISYVPHGLQNLEYQLMERRTRFLSSHGAIRDFKKMIRGMDTPRSCFRKLTGNKFRVRSFRFVDELVQVSWRGITVVDRYSMSFIPRVIDGRKRTLIRFYERVSGKRWPYSKRDTMYLSVAPESFYDSARSYLRDVMALLGYDLSKTVLLNQPFDVYDPRRSMKFFDDPKAVLVDRDPRDIYVLAKCYLKSKGSFIPTDDVEDYIRYHRLVRNDALPADPDIMRMRYEDLIYDYEQTGKRLTDFLGLGDIGSGEKKYFDPAVSIDNTQLFLKHPELAGDIRRIEEALPEYLYPFEKFSLRPRHSQEPF